MSASTGEIFKLKARAFLTLRIFIDDERMPSDVTWMNSIDYTKETWFVARTSHDVFDIIKNHYIGDERIIISFDHDLQQFDEYGKEVTGYDILKSIINMHMDKKISDIPDCYFHTKNPVGKKNMEEYYRSYIDLVRL